MIIHQLYFKGMTIFPLKADPPLIVHADAPLPCSLSAELFQPICWRDPQINNRDSPMEHSQFAKRHLLNIRRKLSRSIQVKDTLRFLTSKAPDHGISV